MNRVKIMLLSFALLAVIGGALAFKAKLGPYMFCYTTTTANTTACIATSAGFGPFLPLRKYYTTLPTIWTENGVEIQRCYTTDGQETIPLLGCEIESNLQRE